ncbi:unnamed protein product [Clonostachys byssicola]|uniref:Uncharacterized protein n=1 Tax=Clonostachys byssicola TaxID=160290 RepID=A0A9N9Y095_9HYPO|nr:unnamed protein product [Clonostachys byssicola]
MKLFLLLYAFAAVTRAADDPSTTAHDDGDVVAGPQDAKLQVVGLQDSISVAVEGKNVNEEHRKIMAKIGLNQVEEHMERVKSKVKDENIQGGEMKMHLTVPDKKYVEQEALQNNADLMRTETREGMTAKQNELNTAKDLAASKAKEILVGQGAQAIVLAVAAREHPVTVPGEHSGKHIMNADGTTTIQGVSAPQKQTTAEYHKKRRERERRKHPPKRPAQDQLAQDQPAQKRPARILPALNQPAQNQPARNQPAQNQPARNQPARNQPAQDQLAQDQIVKDAEEIRSGAPRPPPTDKELSDAVKELKQQAAEWGTDTTGSGESCSVSYGPRGLQRRGCGAANAKKSPAAKSPATVLNKHPGPKPATGPGKKLGKQEGRKSGRPHGKRPAIQGARSKGKQSSRKPTEKQTKQAPGKSGARKAFSTEKVPVRGRHKKNAAQGVMKAGGKKKTAIPKKERCYLKEITQEGYS